MTGALLVAAFHHPLQQRSFAEVIQLHDLPLEGLETLRVGADECRQSGLLKVLSLFTLS